VGQIEDVDTVQEMIVGVAFPAGLHAGEQAMPGFVILVRVLLVRL
jgi:hypothetical protein